MSVGPAHALPWGSRYLLNLGQERGHLLAIPEPVGPLSSDLVLPRCAVGSKAGLGECVYSPTERAVDISRQKRAQAASRGLIWDFA